MGAGAEVDLEIDGVAVRMEAVAMRERGIRIVDGLATFEPVDVDEPLTDAFVGAERRGPSAIERHDTNASSCFCCK